MRLGKKLVALGMVACLSIAGSMMAFAGQTPALSFFGQQPVAESDSDYMTSYKIIVAGKNTISRSDIQVVDSNGWNVSILDSMEETSLSTLAIDDSYMIQLSNDVTDKMQQYWIYCLGDGETAESLGDNAKYVINANGSTTPTQPTEKTATWASDSKGWWIQYSDGTYLTNSWYQSPESGLYYYMGADGYMLHDTTTPDGYTVGSNGAWVENVSSEKEVQQSSDLGLTGNYIFDRAEYCEDILDRTGFTRTLFIKEEADGSILIGQTNYKKIGDHYEARVNVNGISTTETVIIKDGMMTIYNPVQEGYKEFYKKQ